MSDLTNGPVRAIAFLHWAADLRAELAASTDGGDVVPDDAEAV